ncbi:unnamed protein product [Diamesa serratosioi]
MSKSSRNRIQELSAQAELIQEKRKLIMEKQLLMEKLKQKDNSENFFRNDGLFLEKYKSITSSSIDENNKLIDIAFDNKSQTTTAPIIPTKSQTNFTLSPPYMTFMSQSLNAIPSPKPIELKEIPSPKELDLNEIRIPSSSSSSSGAHPFRVFSDNKNVKIPTTIEQLIELVADNGDSYEEKLINHSKNEIVQSAIRFLFDRSSDVYLEYRKKVVSRRQQLMATGSSSSKDKYDPLDVLLDSDDDDHDENARFYDRKFKMSSASSASSTSNVLAVDQQNTGSVEAMAAQSQSDQMSSSARPPKRKKSRWGPDPPNDNNELSLGPVTTTNTTTSSSVTTSALTASISSSSSATTAIVSVTNPILLSTVKRSDPALLQYAKQNFGTINLSEEDWQKAEEHYKVNLLFQDMQRKRQELDFLAKNNKFKYEYDSDEDLNGGSWEHKMRSQEMEATLKWAEALNKQCEGRHHIGDFLPPEEFKKFMEKYDAQKNARQPDISDYKEYKLKEDNIGYQLLQKLGWKEGTALGASGSSGITEPINKASQRDNLQGLGADEVEAPNENDNEYDAYRKRMMLAYRFRPNPLNNPRRAYY